MSRLAIVFSFLAGASFAHDFLGAESCQSCHAEAYAQWKASPHARAKEVLSPAQQKDARCLSCHSPNEAESKVVGVSCETCHGGSQYYSASFVMKDPELARHVGLLDPAEKSCRACHDASTPAMKPFDFTTKLKAIAHGGKPKVAPPEPLKPSGKKGTSK
jgi:formate-dependent nitrite reductase cytochrome c552 subunit